MSRKIIIATSFGDSPQWATSCKGMDNLQEIIDDNHRRKLEIMALEYVPYAKEARVSQPIKEVEGE